MKIIIIGNFETGFLAASKIAGGIQPQILVYEKASICSFGSGKTAFYLANPEADLKDAVETLRQEMRAVSVEAKCRHEVIGVRFDQKQVRVRNLDTDQVYEDSYDKLVIATGSSHQIPQVPGYEKIGVQELKTIEDVIFLREFTKTPYVHNIVIVGGGFAGLELADTFLKLGRSVTIIEKENQLLPELDTDVSAMIQKELVAAGVTVRLGETLKEFTGRTYIEQTVTDKNSYDTDLAMVATGKVPDTGFLHGAGIALEADGAICIHKSMETSVSEVFAAGSCARYKGGALPTTLLTIGNLEIGGTGISEEQARKSGILCKTVLSDLDPDKLNVKVIFDSRTSQIIGAQAWGRNVVSTINMFSAAIKAGMTADQLAKVDVTGGYYG